MSSFKDAKDFKLSTQHNWREGRTIKNYFSVTGDGDVPEVVVQLLQGDLVVHALGLDHLDLLQDVVSLLGGDGQLGDGVGQGLLRLLGFLLHQHDSG